MKNFYRDKGLVISIIVLVIVMVCVAALIFQFSPNLFWLSAPFIVLSSGFAIGKLIQVTNRTFQYFMHIDEEIDTLNQISVYNYPVAVAIVDKFGKLVWFNANFTTKFPDESVYGEPLDIITGMSIEKLLGRENTEIHYKENYYAVHASTPQEKDAKEVYLVYFNDISREKALETELKMSHPVVMIIMIDGYDELFNGNVESETARVTVQIDQLLEKFVGETSGILRKNGRDKFWAVIEEQHIVKIIENKVKVLDSAREIQVTDRTNITLSIGIGRTGKTIIESENFAKQALDMALGRGGDQAVIKTENGFEFYGGMSKGVERQTKVKTRIIANSLIEVVETSDNVYIMGHRFSDLDSIGASVGLACAIRNLGKNAYAVVDTVASLGTQLIDRVKAESGEKNSIFLSPTAAKGMFTPDSLLIVVDTHNPNLLEDKELYQNAEKVVVIDHHRKMVNFIDNAIIFHHESYASSASEMVTELLVYFGNAGRLTATQAEALMAGIMLDTKNFTIKTGVRTFEAAALLKNMKADTINVKGLFANSLDSYKQKARLVAEAVIYKKCAVASTDTVSSEMRIIAPQAADELLGIIDVVASFVLYLTPNGEIYISARSLGGMNVQLVMEYLGGGGHQTMAGVQLKDISLAEARNMVIKAIDNYYENHQS